MDMNFMGSDGRIDAGEAGGPEPPRRLSGTGSAESADNRAGRIVRGVDGGADTLVEACVGGIAGGCVSNAVGCEGRGAHRSRRRGRHFRRPKRSGSRREVGA